MKVTMSIVRKHLRIPDTEFSLKFVQGMADRMAMSFGKYGHLTEEAVKKNDPIANLLVRLKKYQDTGNTEWLMDVGNCAMIEFMFPQHPDAHFRATDSHESPGRSKRGTGELTHEANTHEEENRRRGAGIGVYNRDGD
jgi:hypothetical protein